MKPEENLDEGLLLDWRGDVSYASEYQQSTPPLKQKKTAMSSGAATNRVTMKSVIATEIITSAAPVVYDLSDSETILVRRLAERRAAAAKPPSSSLKPFINMDVVTLASDSEEDVSPDAAVKPSDKVEKPGHARTQGGLMEMFISIDDEEKVGSKFCGMPDKLIEPASQAGLLEVTFQDDDGRVGPKYSVKEFELRETVSEGGLPTKDSSLYDNGMVWTKLSESLEKLREPVSQGGLLEMSISIHDEGMSGSKFSGKAVKLTEIIRKRSSLEAISLDMEGTVSSLSSRSAVPFAETEAVVQNGDCPRREDGFSRATPSVAWTAPELLHKPIAARRNIKRCLDENLQPVRGCRRRPIISTEDPDVPDAALGTSQKCLRTPHELVHEEDRCGSPVRLTLNDLTSSVDDISPCAKFQFPGKLEKCREPITHAGIWENHPRVGHQRMTGSISNASDVDAASEVAAACIVQVSPRWNDASPMAGPSSTWESLVVKSNSAKESNVGARINYLQTGCDFGEPPKSVSKGLKWLDPARDICGSEAKRLSLDHEPAYLVGSRQSQGALPHICRDEEWRGQSLLNLGGNGELNDQCPGNKRQLLSTRALRSHENFWKTVSFSAAEGLQVLDPAEGAVGNCFREVENFVQDKTRSSPVQQALEHLIGDEDSCSLGPECLHDHEPESRRGRLNSRGSATQNFGEQGSHDQFLPKLAGNSEMRNHTACKEHAFRQISDLSSDEYRETTKDLDSERWILVEDKAKRKCSRSIGVAADTRALYDARNSENIFPSTLNVSKARKGPVSEEKAAAKEALRQRERKLKKSAQQEDNNAREETRKGLKKRKVVAKEQKGAAERRELEKELQKGNNRWKKGKSALQNITVYLDTTVVEIKELGSLILRQLGLKGYNYKVASNPIERTIVWNMKWTSAESQVDTDGLGSPADDIICLQLSSSQAVLEVAEVKYIVVVLQGEEFSDLLSDKKLHAYLSRVRNQYPTHSVCALINGLMKLLYKKEQHQFKTGGQSWTRPNVEKALAEFISHHPGVHSRLCIDESEIADHLVGLTRSFAEYPFKKRLTSLSVNANEDHVTKGVIKKSTWLKFLVAIPHVNGAMAIAVSKEYPTMRSLLNIYLDPLRTVHEKEHVLQALLKSSLHGVTGSDGRCIGPNVSRRIYQSLMAKDGNQSTEGVEEADHFT